jgi:hypothetical protein
MAEPLDEIRQLHAELIEGYQGPDDRPLGSYGVLEAVYGGGVLGFALFLAASGRQLPERIPGPDLALLGVATYKATRTVSKEKVTSSLRSPFRRYVEDSHGTEVNEEARGTGMRRAVGELLGCPFCLSQWIATALACGFVVAPRATRLVGAVFVTRAISDLMQYAHTAVVEKVEG